MATKNEILGDVDFISNQLSTQVRTVALSVIAVVWLFLVGGKDMPILPTSPNHTLLLLGGGLSLAALLVDYFQYLMGYLDGKRVLRTGERNGVTDFKYDYKALTYRLRGIFFWLKQMLV